MTIRKLQPNARLAQKRECQIEYLSSQVQSSLEVTFCCWNSLFHLVNPLMPILTILFVGEKLKPYGKNLTVKSCW